MLVSFGERRTETQNLLIKAAIDRRVRDPYTGKPLNNPQIEHVKPRCTFKPGQGKHYLGNLLVVQLDKRGCERYDTWLRKNSDVPDYLQKYLDDMRGVVIKGVDYVKAAVKVLNREAAGIVRFHGNHRVKKKGAIHD